MESKDAQKVLRVLKESRWVAVDDGDVGHTACSGCSTPDYRHDVPCEYDETIEILERESKPGYITPPANIWLSVKEHTPFYSKPVLVHCPQYPWHLAGKRMVERIMVWQQPDSDDFVPGWREPHGSTFTPASEAAWWLLPDPDAPGYHESPDPPVALDKLFEIDCTRPNCKGVMVESTKRVTPPHPQIQGEISKECWDRLDGEDMPIMRCLECGFLDKEQPAPVLTVQVSPDCPASERSGIPTEVSEGTETGRVTHEESSVKELGPIVYEAPDSFKCTRGCGGMVRGVVRQEMRSMTVKSEQRPEPPFRLIYLLECYGCSYSTVVPDPFKVDHEPVKVCPAPKCGGVMRRGMATWKEGPDFSIVYQEVQLGDDLGEEKPVAVWKCRVCRHIVRMSYPLEEL